jgi:hypothetical protein
MLNRIGTGISIKQTTPTEVQENTSTPEQTQVPVAPTEEVVTQNSAEMKSDLEMFGSFQRTSLFKQLEKAPLTSEQAQKEARFEFPRLFRSPLEGNDYRLFKKDFAPLLNQTLSTGSSDDIVDINKDQDGIIRVMHNGKEVWNGTEREFRSLVIDTGDGDDVVNDNVGNATILTGRGVDTVNENAAESTIDTGDDDDVVNIAGGLFGSGGNIINAGKGNDKVYGGGKELWIGGNPAQNSTDGNRIDLGEGDDIVSLLGQDNIINTGGDKDVVEVSPVDRDASNTVDGKKY